MFYLRRRQRSNPAPMASLTFLLVVGVSEQFLNGTSAHRRPFHVSSRPILAIFVTEHFLNLISPMSKYLRLMSDTHT